MTDNVMAAVKQMLVNMAGNYIGLSDRHDPEIGRSKGDPITDGDIEDHLDSVLEAMMGNDELKALTAEEERDLHLFVLGGLETEFT